MTDFPAAPPFGTESDMLIAFNDHQRAGLLWKLAGLTDDQLTRTQPPFR